MEVISPYQRARREKDCWCVETPIQYGYGEQVNAERRCAVSQLGTWNRDRPGDACGPVPPRWNYMYLITH